ncbi:MAG: hypothetical protein GTO41_06265 [Burkholderiales bacterium]|nr:hypothetical protein [Burkholderiales bacterium]
MEELTQVDERVGALRKLQYLRARLEASGRFRHVFLSTSTYSAKLLARLQSGSKAHGEKRLTPKNEPFVENAGTAQRPLKAQP